MKAVFFMALLFCAGLLSAQQPIELKIWPNEISGQKEMYEPTLTIYPAPKGNGMAIIACPGGGYTILALQHEGHNMAQWFTSQGITYAVLKYRMPNGHKEIPLSDAQQALRILRQHASEWKINQIGIMGFSAGGHLASTVATHFTDSITRPDFQILFYPVITMNPAYTHMGSHNNLLGKNATKEDEIYFSNELQVTEQTPPAFILHSSDDTAVPVENSLNYYKALLKHGIPTCLHTYPIGGHGWGYNDSFTYKRQWTGELEKWLREINK